jgi:Protein of unknown function (DUF2783)
MTNGKNQDQPPTTLDTSSRFADPDAAFRALIEAHRGLSEAESTALNARLVLLLANHIGDHAVLADAIRQAKAAAGGDRQNVADAPSE